MSIQKAEMSIEQIENGQIVEHVAYPYVEYEHVTMENGMDIMSMIRDDVSTPMVTHNATSWKVGQGDSDVSESIVDSSVASMTIKGQTYQNILPDPALRNSMTNGKTMQKLNEGYDSVSTVDGVCKSAILSGNTLVNILTEPITNHTFTTGKANTQNTTQLQANKKYIAFIDIANVTNEATGIYIRIHNTHPNGNSVVLPIKDEKFTVGLHKLIFTMPSSSYNEFEIMIGFVRNAEATVTYNYAMVIEYQQGMENWDIPYFEGMQSVKMPVLTTTNGGIHNSDEFEQGSLSATDGSLANITNRVRTKKAYSTNNGTKIIFNENTLPLRMVFFYNNSNFVAHNGSWVNSNEIDIPQGVTEFKVVFQSDDVSKLPKNITIMSDTHKSNILRTPEEVVLRSLPNGVKDTLNLNTGEYVQRIGEITLNGSETNWSVTNQAGWESTPNTIAFGQSFTPRAKAYNASEISSVICDKFATITANGTWGAGGRDEAGVSINQNSRFDIRIERTKLSDESLTAFKQWLSQNPITVQYELATPVVKTVDLSILDQDNQPTTQLNSFANGYIQVSSQGLIPSVDYEVPTSNSYHVDLMKPNTQYTMKNMQGTFTIDNIQYNASTNGTFTSPSALTNNFMITSVAQSQPMLLEGDVREKDIPYFKGIKSAFEDESKIEVLSTGKNLYSHGDSAFTPERDGWYFINGDRETLFGDKVHKDCGQGAWFYLEGGRYYFNVVGNDNVKTLQVVGEKERLYGSGATIPKGWYALRMRVQNANQEVSITNVMVEKDTETNYEPYKSNSTKIPLLSPLRSLPNGVYDELIIDRMKKKATLIQRIKSTVFNGSEDWNLNNYSHDKLIEFVCHSGAQMAHTVFSDRFITGGENVERVAFSGGSIYIRILKTKVSNVDSFKKWLSQNPLTVQYGLQTPLITEVNLEGYPYVYKGGHIFLNTEIAPATEVTYSINQAHQIESSNEDILRHQNEINHLYQLIAQYVQVQYEAELIDIALQG